MIIISFPEINSKLNIIKEADSSENRTKADQPIFDENAIENYLKEYDIYFKENFSFRNDLIQFLGYFELYFFNYASVPDQVITGKDNWLFEMKSAPNYKGLNHFMDDQLIRIKEEIETRTKWAAKRGIKYYVVVVPNKMNIYPEYLPKQIIKLSNENRYDQVISLNNPPFSNIIDVRKNILLHKDGDYLLYQKTDDHWNDLGAYYGYEGIIKSIQKDFKDIPVISRDSFELSYVVRTGGLARLLSIENKVTENFIELSKKTHSLAGDGPLRNYFKPDQISDWDFQIIKENKSIKSRKCLFIRDSFTFLMVKYFQESFNECVFIHDAWLYKMHPEMIIKEKPDIVLNIILETELHKLLENSFTYNDSLLVEQSVQIKNVDGDYISLNEDKSISLSNNSAEANRKFIICWKNISDCNFISSNKNFVGLENSNSGNLIANNEFANDLQLFKIIAIDKKFSIIKASNNLYLKTDSKSGRLLANATTEDEAERFIIEKSDYYSSR